MYAGHDIACMPEGIGCTVTSSVSAVAEALHVYKGLNGTYKCMMK